MILHLKATTAATKIGRHPALLEKDFWIERDILACHRSRRNIAMYTPAQ
jgi:hypothetical protein